jgi:hypothetical protein
LCRVIEAQFSNILCYAVASRRGNLLLALPDRRLLDLEE